MKMRVQTGDGHRYTLTIYPAGQPESSGVTISNLQGPSGFGAGSALLVAHHVDAEFGDVQVRRVNPETAPTITPAAGTYNSGQLVTITSPDPKATIRYTLDGRPPTATSPVYDGPFRLNVTAEVRAMAVRDGLDVSGVATSVYEIKKSTAIVSDDFSTGALDSSVWTVVDPVGDVRSYSTATNFVLDVPGARSHNLWVDQLFAPRVLQYAQNEDFQIDAKIDGTFNGTFNMQGLLVQQTMEDLVRVDVFSSGNQRRVFVATFKGGKETVIANVNVSNQLPASFYLRVTRTRSTHQFRVEWSPDNTTWNLVAAFVHPMAVSSVGFWTGNHNDIPSATPAIQGSIDFFSNTAAPAGPDDATPPANVRPIVRAGVDRSATLGSPITLAGSVTDDGVPSPYTSLWTKVSGPGTAVFSDATMLSPTVNFDEDGVYVLKLSANDGALTASDIMEVTVRRPTGAPVVTMPSRGRVGKGAIVPLNGSVVDPDGLPDPVSVVWSKESGPGTVAFANPTAASTTATFDTPGIYVLKLVATDGQYVTSSASSSRSSRCAAATDSSPCTTSVTSRVTSSAMCRSFLLPSICTSGT